MNEVFRDVGEDDAYFRAVQSGRYSHIYSVTLRVRNDGEDGTFSPESRKRSAILQIEEDAEFHITHMAACVMAPVDTNSVRSSDYAPTLPMAGVTLGRSDRGVVFRLSEVGSGRLLCLGQARTIGPAGTVMAPTAAQTSAWWAAQGYLPLEAVFPPAYSFEFLQPIAFEYFLPRNRRLQLDLVNRDSDGGDPPGVFGHRVTFAFIGNRYDA